MKFIQENLAYRNFKIYPKEEFIISNSKYLLDEERFDHNLKCYTFYNTNNYPCAEPIAYHIDFPLIDYVEIYIPTDFISSDDLSYYIKFCNSLGWVNNSLELLVNEKINIIAIDSSNCVSAKHLLALYTLIRYCWCTAYNPVYNSILRNIERLSKEFNNDEILYLSFMDPELEYSISEDDLIDAIYYYSLYPGVHSIYKEPNEILSDLEDQHLIHNSFSRILNDGDSLSYSKKYTQKGTTYNIVSSHSKENEINGIKLGKYITDSVYSLFNQNKYKEIFQLLKSLHKKETYNKELLNKINSYNI